jgi:hypothetical protein
MKTPGYVRDLLAEEGIDDALQTTFIVHLLSHGRQCRRFCADLLSWL